MFLRGVSSVGVAPIGFLLVSGGLGAEPQEKNGFCVFTSFWEVWMPFLKRSRRVTPLSAISAPISKYNIVSFKSHVWCFSSRNGKALVGVGVLVDLADFQKSR